MPFISLPTTATTATTPSKTQQTLPSAPSSSSSTHDSGVTHTTSNTTTTTTTTPTPTPSTCTSVVAKDGPQYHHSFYLADLDPSSPSSSSTYTPFSSEPPAPVPDMTVHTTRSRSVSRTPSLPASDNSRSDFKSMPVTPKAPGQPDFLPDEMPLPPSSAPTSPFQSTHTLPTPQTPTGVQASRIRGDSAPVIPSTHSSTLPHYASGHAHSLSHPPVHAGHHHHHPHSHYGHHHSGYHHSFAQQQAALRSSQYTDLFLLEPHEYDSITDGELVRLYDRGVIDSRVLDQIVDASIRIQRACTDADRAVSIKTRRAMIRQALES